VTQVLTHLPRAVASGPRPGTIDAGRARRAAAELLDALGVDLTDESLRDTPRRMAAMYAELLTPAPFAATTFPNDGGYDELVVATGIPFHSMCEHHLLPFVGVAHVGYLPGDRIIGLSKLARVVELFARRLQVQERLTSRWRTGSSSSWRPRASAWCSRPSTSACRCAGCRSPGRVRSPQRCTGSSATMPERGRSSSH